MVLAIDCCCCLFIVCGHLNNARSLMNSPRSGHTIASFEFDLLSNSERGPINCKTMRFILISRPQRVDKENNRNLEQNFLHLGVARKRSIFWCCIIQRKMSIVFTNCFQCEIKWCFIEEIVQVEICSCTLLIYKVVSQNFDNDLNKSYPCSGMKFNTNFLLWNCVKRPNSWIKFIWNSYNNWTKIVFILQYAMSLFWTITMIANWTRC